MAKSSLYCYETVDFGPDFNALDNLSKIAAISSTKEFGTHILYDDGTFQHCHFVLSRKSLDNFFRALESRRFQEYISHDAKKIYTKNPVNTDRNSVHDGFTYSEALLCNGHIDLVDIENIRVYRHFKPGGIAVVRFFNGDICIITIPENLMQQFCGKKYNTA